MEERVYHEMRRKEDEFWWHRGMRAIHAVFLDALFSKNKKNVILDVGCGTGGMLELLSRYGAVYGVDASDTAVTLARSRNIGTITRASVEKLPFRGAFFDLVTCFDVLYHRSITSDDAVLQELSRVMKPGGALLVREPAFQWLYGRHDRVVWTRRRYSKKELVSKIESAGFTVQRATYVNFFLLPFLFVERLASGLRNAKNDSRPVFHDYAVLGSLFFGALFLEAYLLKYMNFPFGSSVVCVAKKR